jgi:ectoine hydroxylase-related dioxygenase (phytanoyl-CoA dioxygenase family)
MNRNFLRAVAVSQRAALMLTDQQLADYTAHFKQNGYVIVRNLFSPEECQTLREHYMTLRASGEKPGDFAGVNATESDPLKKFPRLIHMHRYDKPSLDFLTDSRINRCLTAFLGAEPLACQTMLYFKPPGARGQALHQDNFYLKAAPGTCAAAWLALDPCDEANGCMQVIPRSDRWGLLCTKPADVTQSFTNVEVPLPETIKPVPCIMAAGDVLFFNGETVHGSFPNTTTDRFRRSLIAHYVEGNCTRLTEFDQPVLKMDGTVMELEKSTGGGPCGIWVDKNGEPVVEMSGTESKPLMKE